MGHKLFLVHGMGHYAGKSWGDEVWGKVVECSRLYPHFEANPLAGYAAPVPITYGDLFVKALENWDRQGQSFEAFAKAMAPEAGDFGWLNGISKDSAGFLLTHVADVVIYRFFPNQREQIRTRVLRDIFKVVKDSPRTRFSVMAHSLGTAVSHDALAQIASARKIDGHYNAFSARHFKFDSIHMLANVSRILETAPGVYQSFVRPGAPRDRDRNCLCFFSHRHALDPFTRPRPFQPHDWGGGFTPTPELNHYRGWNVHGWLHYLDHPRVHIPLLRSLSKPSAIPLELEQEAVQNYPQFGGELENVAQAKQKIADLETLAGKIEVERGLAENFATIQGLLGTLLELRDIAGASWRKLEGAFA